MSSSGWVPYVSGFVGWLHVDEEAVVMLGLHPDTDRLLGMGRPVAGEPRLAGMFSQWHADTRVFEAGEEGKRLTTVWSALAGSMYWDRLHEACAHLASMGVQCSFTVFLDDGEIRHLFSALPHTVSVDRWQPVVAVRDQYLTAQADLVTQLQQQLGQQPDPVPEPPLMPPFGAHVTVYYQEPHLGRLFLASHLFRRHTQRLAPFEGGPPLEQLLSELGADSVRQFPHPRPAKRGYTNAVTAVFDSPDTDMLVRALHVMAHAGMHIDARIISGRPPAPRLTHYRASLDGHRLTETQHVLRTREDLNYRVQQAHRLHAIAEHFHAAGIPFPTLDAFRA